MKQRGFICFGVQSYQSFKSKVWSLKILKIMSLLSQWTYLIFWVNPEKKSTKISILRITTIVTWHSSHIVPRNPWSQRHFPHSHTPRSEQIVYKTKTEDWKSQKHLTGVSYKINVSFSQKVAYFPWFL